MTTVNQFGTSLYRTTDEMLTAIAEAWLLHPHAEMPEDDAAAAAHEAPECITAWGLDQPGDDGAPAHMALNDYTAADLEAALAAERARLAAEMED